MECLGSVIPHKGPERRSLRLWHLLTRGCFTWYVMTPPKNTHPDRLEGFCALIGFADEQRTGIAGTPHTYPIWKFKYN